PTDGIPFFPSPTMLCERFPSAMVVWAPAKVNLHLEILGKRADGYHEIETLMVAISLFDTLVFKEEPSSNLHLTCQRRDLSCGLPNLVLRAAWALQQASGTARGARIRLAKRIPMGAGLGGGSADAAATLLGLTRLWQLPLSVVDLTRIGATLGSDVPF